MSDDYGPPRRENLQSNELGRRLLGGGDGLWRSPYVDRPLRGIDDSETNATRRLFQFAQSRDVYGLNLMRFFENPRSNFSEASFLEWPLYFEAIGGFDKLYRDVRSEQRAKDIIPMDIDSDNGMEEDGDALEESSDEFSDDGKDLHKDWTPIMGNFELYKGHAKSTSDMGELLFAHKSMKKFVLINLWLAKRNPDGSETFKEDHEIRLRSLANRFLALVHYLPIGEIEWVRATYTTSDRPQTHPKLLDKLHEYEYASPGQSLLLHLPVHRVQRCLTAKDVSALDTYIKALGYDVPDQAEKDSVLIPLGANDPTEIHFEWLSVNLGHPLTPSCNHCRESFACSQLKACSGCRSVLYCSQKCQIADWPFHKVVLCPKR